MLSLANCCLACDRCNRMKGSLTETEFRALLVVLGDMLRTGALHIDGFNDVIKIITATSPNK